MSRSFADARTPRDLLRELLVHHVNEEVLTSIRHLNGCETWEPDEIRDLLRYAFTCVTDEIPDGEIPRVSKSGDHEKALAGAERPDWIARVPSWEQALCPVCDVLDRDDAQCAAGSTYHCDEAAMVPMTVVPKEAFDRLLRERAAPSQAGGHSDDEPETELARAVQAAQKAGLWPHQIRTVVERDLPRDLMADLQASFSRGTTKDAPTRQEWQLVARDGQTFSSGSTREAVMVAVIDGDAERFGPLTLQRRIVAETEWVDAPAPELEDADD